MKQPKSFELMLDVVIRVRCLRNKQPFKILADFASDPPRLPLPPTPLSFNIGFQRSGISLRKKQPHLRESSGSFQSSMLSFGGGRGIQQRVLLSKMAVYLADTGIRCSMWRTGHPTCFHSDIFIHAFPSERLTKLTLLCLCILSHLSIFAPFSGWRREAADLFSPL